MKLSLSAIKTLALPAGVSEKTFFCDGLPNFGVRIRAGGGKTYVVQYKVHSKNRRMPLGSVTAIDLGKARAAARDILAKVRLGEDPVAEKIQARQKSATTFASLLPRFLERQRSRAKPRYFEEVDRHLTAHAKPLHDLGIETIDRRAIAILLGEIAGRSGPAAANRVGSSLSAYFGWLMREGIVDANPAMNRNKATEAGARSHVITDAELGRIWAALGDDQYSSIVKLLLLCGCRRDEVASLCWSEIDLDKATITLSGERTKNKREHVVPLSVQALAVLGAQPRRLNADGTPRDLVFGHGDGRGWQAWSGPKKVLDAKIGIREWRLHDCRRVMSTVMNERLGVDPWIVESCLGHVVAGIASVYNRSTYLEQRRVALQKWANHILLQAGEQPSNVVTLRR